MARGETFDVAVIGGGPSGATAANDLARSGLSVLLLDKAGRIKPCGGAIPPKLVDDFGIPEHLLVARIRSARIVSPKSRSVDMPIDGGFVGMVDRDVFDEWLRCRAAANGAERVSGTFETLNRGDDGTSTITYRAKGAAPDAPLEAVRARAVIGADGALSAVARQCVPGAEKVPFVFAYHEIVRTPEEGTAAYDPARCDVYYNGAMSPDFYSWIFPHGQTMSIGTGSAHKGFSLKGAVGDLRGLTGLAGAETIRREGAPIPLKPLKRWDDGRNVLLAGDAAGVVAPASGEGIYYAMLGGRLAADAVGEFCRTGDARALRTARRRFMRVHGPVFWILGVMQTYWYGTDERRERFVRICRDKDVQTLTWDAYMNKELVKARPLAHVRIFFKNLAHLTGLASA
ncbi:geranylgeranyl diphosphate reductase [Elioraea rosea]|uniref:geranylgeranyl diphosphate reductase n=1 Tax=Elioraea rosea TaxID=2492390 RepID=UPI001182C1E2|nr:geranylgeranyl diphosphate reductase [Elioraea rosea]